MSDINQDGFQHVNDFAAKVAERVKQLRKKKGYSNQEHFAWDHGLSRSQYGKWEQGADMRISSLERLFNALEITPREFFSEGFE
ncbi:helix-turn-helix domain-containing protein [Chitinophaga sp. CF418]|uniref:helix-turn-helix domain-containing protein n=1 Tax=Chitinophaga sp. CF418 TaxID=1855287 RepID=UPI000920846B|nr:helix-turn-helix transcriptional regulator [Chitinophaga sp. CF418]SHN42278.1 Helix-turn-helix domain-containing protein [Chitinophaga sp. CF418]